MQKAKRQNLLNVGYFLLYLGLSLVD